MSRVENLCVKVGGTKCFMTYSQLFEGLKCESQTENNKRARSQSTLFGSQHYKGVEGHARALGWD
jgi:hypothetical protein